MAECNGNARQQSLNQLNGTEALGRCPVRLGAPSLQLFISVIIQHDSN